ncbi:MAG: TetR/AcrR family transcriptional regulator [Chloroflexi bacterium]|nr:TetR/AcrR family transcriptional regulator [Chloroflexota bacterium]
MTDNYHHGDLKNALIQAGLAILSQEGVQALSLRKVAKHAGVSHAAPYSHFTDKQALIAAIATEGYKKLYEQVSAVAVHYQADPRSQLIETAWAYVQFAIDTPDHFKITFSGIVEREHDYPDYVEQAQKNFALIVEVIESCQRQNILQQGDSELLMVSIWSGLHGLIHLLLGNQLPSKLLNRVSAREILLFQLNHFFVGDTP